MPGGKARSRPARVRKYQEALKLGGSRPLPELFEAAGCRFDFSAKTVRPLVQLIREELRELKGKAELLSRAA